MSCVYLSLFYILKFLVTFLPKKMLYKFADLVALISYKFNKKHRKIIDINLQICFPNKDKNWREQTSLNIYKNYAKFGIDFIKNQNITKEELVNKIHFENQSIVEELIQSDIPLIVTTAHYGNWELLALLFGAKFKGISIVARPLDSKVMDKILSKNRKQFDIELIEKKGGLKKMLKALKEKRTLGILTDQHASDSESIKISYFNQEVNFISGASVLAKKVKGVILPCFVYQKDGQFFIKNFQAMYASEKSIEELTLYQAKCCEEMIKFKPDEYFFFHKRFKSKVKYKV
ncbi:lipid A biosynthesis lauroyl acyltransferase [Campylobacter insulaenigrae]|uniref:lipid A biosynthesis lauroyl acyltransferase n=1 Tax=Campylobacter insulaenigrae TaxID=260714 RepID=UPI002152E888|nr:lipid A biosynthesis lauroyl acyltransferase [Campylobacter insulaenigrae]MCR6570936.1 lipid A biosynthesis lauroyl acyltransferase [Campylobacter insulaenigrae]MCR6572405.1 lipid A biosynthesis lauroyl acyltransferase [Campylobacter insulaenigrae]MCR6578619.1 lipid A biosynthesis lauroyl acyltransferase [Campylobacter insulaenigrae]MCR6581782.1 lipid A biosynthesis lauroyl acyltransferase [Campylobacter insulaenigrae]MCR6587748.1 lipid A biosynthesis lauroyl acyltransferase [Campylobacter 